MTPGPGQGKLGLNPLVGQQLLKGRTNPFGPTIASSRVEDHQKFH